MAAAFRIALSLVGVLLSSVSAAAARPPNVVVFLVDDMGWSDWEQGGRPEGSRYYETPNLNRLASEGVTFSNAYSAAAVCSPTRNALLTGRNPARTRMTQWLPGGSHPSTLSDPDWSRALDAADVTLAEALRTAGYATGFVGKWHLGPQGSAAADPLAHGFDSNVGGNANGGVSPWVGYFANQLGSFQLPGLGRGTALPGDYLTDRLTDFAVDFIDRHADATRPFFLYFSHYGVHAPLQAPAHLVAKYLAKTPTERHSHATYAAMLESVDDSLGRILEALDARGIREDTLVIVASDNGGSLGATSNAPLRGGKGLLYEGGIRTPLVVSWTGNRRIEAGSESRRVVVSHDLYPAILEMTENRDEIAWSQASDGDGFRAALEGSPSPRRAVFWHYPHISPQSTNAEGGRFVSAMRSGRWKLLYFFERDVWELYDLAKDLSETRDLIDTCPRTAARLTERLVEWLVEVDAQLPIDTATGVAVPLPQPLDAAKQRDARQCFRPAEFERGFPRSLQRRNPRAAEKTAYLPGMRNAWTLRRAESLRPVSEARPRLERGWRPRR